MVWIAGLKVRAAFLESDWSASEPMTLVTLQPPIGGVMFLSDAQVAWNGSEFYATWRAVLSAPVLHVEGTRITADGTVVDSRHVIHEGGSPGSFRDNSLLVIGNRFFKSWVAASVRTTFDFLGSWIENGASSTPASLQQPVFPPPPTYGTLIALPNGELAIVRPSESDFTIERLGGTRRRSSRS